MPNIVANALSIGFVIVYLSQRHGKLCVNVVTSRNENNTYWVVLYKSGTHYDAVIPAFSFLFIYNDFNCISPITVCNDRKSQVEPIVDLMQTKANSDMARPIG